MGSNNNMTCGRTLHIFSRERLIVCRVDCPQQRSVMHEGLNKASLFVRLVKYQEYDLLTPASYGEQDVAMLIEAATYQ